MKYVCILILLTCVCSAKCQLIKKNKDEAISEIKQHNSTITFLEKNPNDFYYTRYDDLGEVKVLYVTENNTVKKVLFISNEPTKVLQRIKEVWRTITPQINDSDKSETGIVFRGTKSIYYSGLARYEAVTNYEEKKFYIEVILLD